MKHCWCGRGAAILLFVLLGAGCGTDGNRPTPTEMPGAGVVDLDGAIVNARQANRPIVLLVGEFGPTGADSQARDLLEEPAIKSRSDGIESLTIDLGISRNRATAARFHVTQTPILVCLSPNGLIVSRDEGPVSASLLAARVEGLAQRAADLDAKLAVLRDAVAKNGGGSEARLALAEFLLARRNAREAVPPLAAVAHSDAVEPSVRVRAWVALARAHLWIAEPEKGRHEARNLIATLGPVTADAVAGGNLVLGLQDANAKRIALARQELEAAISAAADSVYAKQARDALAQLPKEGK